MRMAIAAIFVVGIHPAFAESEKISGNLVKIGVLADMSGVYSDIGGPGSVAAAQMAVEDFKAKAKPVFNVEVVYADHLNKADVASAKVREWLDTGNVDMVTDGANSAC